MRFRPSSSTFAAAIAGLLLSVLGATAEAVTVPGQYPTIQAAVNAVKSGALPSGTSIDVAPGNFARFDILGTSKAMTIRSTGGPSVTSIVGDGAQSVIRIESATGAIRIEGFTIRGGQGVNGRGGGFTAFQATSVLFVNCDIRNNASGEPGGGGGVVSTGSNARFEDTIIRSNTAARLGGGVVATASSNVTFVGGEIRDNTVTGPNGGGGGVYMGTGSSGTFQRVRIAGNKTTLAGGGLHIFNNLTGAPATLTVQDCLVELNTSLGTSGAEAGGIHVERNANATIARTLFRANTSTIGGALHILRGTVTISDSIFRDNTAQTSGGGAIGVSSLIEAGLPLDRAARVTITGTAILSNQGQVGGAIWMLGENRSSRPTNRSVVSLTDSLVAGNSSTAGPGGGLHATVTDLTLVRTLVQQNRTPAATGIAAWGGGIYLENTATLTLTDSTVARNTASERGGGIYAGGAARVAISASRIYANTAQTGGGLAFSDLRGAPTGFVNGSEITNNTTCQVAEFDNRSVTIGYQNDNVAGPTDLFCDGAGGPRGQTVPEFERLSGGSGTTSKAPTFVEFEATPDSFVPSVSSTFTPQSILAWVAPGATTTVVPGVVSGDPSDSDFATVSGPCTEAYQLVYGGIVGPNVTVTGQTCDPRDVAIGTAPGAGGRPSVVAWGVNRASGAASPYASVLPYPASFTAGASVATYRQGRQIFLATGGGSGSQIRVFDVTAGGAPALIASFAAFTTAQNRNGVSVALGDLEGDGVVELAVGSGPGGPQRVRLYRLTGANPPPQVMEFNPYPEPVFKNGMSVAFGNVDADAPKELVFGAGPGDPNSLRAFDVNVAQQAIGFRAGRNAFGPGVGRFGVYVAAGDLDSDGVDEIIAGGGRGGPSTVKIFRLNLATSFPDLVGRPLAAYPAGLKAGARVAAGNVDGDAALEVITGPGPGTAPQVRAYDFVAGGVPSATGVNYLAYPMSQQTGVFVSGFAGP